MNIIKSILFASILIPTLAQNLHAQWVIDSTGMGLGDVYCFTSMGSTLFASCDNKGIFKSTNNGATWSITGSFSGSPIFYAMESTPTTLFAEVSSGNPNFLYSSSNLGANWVQTSLNSNVVYSLAISGSSIIAGSSNIYKSTNNGATWSVAVYNTSDVLALATTGNNIFAGTRSNGILLSTNNGNTWVQKGLSNLAITSLTISTGTLFVGAANDSGMYKSTDNGTTWLRSGLNGKTIYTLANSGNTIIAGTYNYGIYVSTNNGVSWTQRNEGITGNDFILSLYIFNNYIFAGEYSRGIVRRPLSELTGAALLSTSLPGQFSLLQNYPNPFNPSTKISFEVNKSGNVKIQLFDNLGKEIRTLVNNFYTSGSYQINFNAESLSAGTYYYKLTAGEFTATRKMLLLK